MPFTFINPSLSETQSEEEQLRVMRSWLFRLTDELRFAFEQAETGKAVFENEASKSETAAEKTEDGNNNGRYNQLKELIIKTADLVTSETQRIEATLKENYVAQSEFGEYTKNANMSIAANADGIVNAFKNIETVNEKFGSTDLVNGNYKVDTEQYIKLGLLYYDDTVPRYGVAVGENLTTVVIDGKEVINRQNLLATFTSNRLSFWQGNVEIAYLSNNKLYIRNVEILGNLAIEDWIIDTSDGFAIKYRGK